MNNHRFLHLSLIVMPKTIPQPIGTILNALLAERGYLSVCREYEVAHQWDTIVGSRLALVSHCTRVENGVLYVRVDAAAWRQEISYLKEHILTTIRTTTTCASINDIVFY